jgi:integrase
MIGFKGALWDGSDPTYAPCTGASDGHVYWKAPKKYRDAGYAMKSKRLVGKVGDGLDLKRAAEARDLTRDMVRWYEEGEVKAKPGTWSGLIGRYKSDDISPLQEVQPNTRKSYLEHIAYWEPVLGDEPVEDFDFAEAKRIEKGMRDNGRSRSFIKKRFTMLRMIVGYGVAIKWAHAAAIRDVLSEVKTKTPKPRSASPTDAQITAIIAAADEAGDSSFALGVMFQWNLALRAMDVRGDFFDLRPGEERSGICRGQKRWVNGLTWDMFDRDVTTLTKTPSKTDESLPDQIVWDLTLVPTLRARLLDVPAEKRVGPVIVDQRGMPYDRFMWGKLWRTHRKTAKVPDTIWMMDTRAGAINDAKRKGASKIEMQQQANHASGATTERYIRERSEGANNVLRIRAERS